MRADDDCLGVVVEPKVPREGVDRVGVLEGEEGRLDGPHLDGFERRKALPKLERKFEVSGGTEVRLNGHRYAPKDKAMSVVPAAGRPCEHFLNEEDDSKGSRDEEDRHEMCGRRA